MLGVSVVYSLSPWVEVSVARHWHEYDFAIGDQVE